MYSAGVGIARDHLILLQSIDTDAVLNRGSEIAGSEDVRLLPHTVLRIVGKERAGAERVTIIGAGRISCRRYRNAVVKDGAASGELTQKPTVLKLIVEHDRIA